MEAPSLSRYVESGVTLLGDTLRPNGVTFAFTERTGGVSKPPYANLNLGSRCGDDPACVAENRAQALAALGAYAIADRLVEPRQVHGDAVVVIDSAEPDALAAARALAQAGADAIVCTVPGVPVLLCFADCVPIVLTAPGGFAVVHSGWRGTLARIGAKALAVLCEQVGCAPEQVTAYVGPHVSGADYEVSPELLATFEGEFGTMVHAAETESKLDLSAAIRCALEQAGADPASIVDTCPSTVSNTDRFYSYRAEGGLCGRHAAIAYL